jgi:hypothetical protein
MRNFILVIASFVSLLLIGNVAGCLSSGVAETGRIAPPDLVTVALPFVEAIHVPAEIHAGQPFTISVDLSSKLNPAALRSPEHPFSRDHFKDSYSNVTSEGITYTYYAVIRPFRDLTQVSSSLPVLASVNYSFDPFPPGVYTLHYLSAPVREEGGANVQVYRHSSDPYNFPLGTDMSIKFTVLP